MRSSVPARHSSPNWSIDRDAKNVVVPATVACLSLPSFPRGPAVEVLEFERGSQVTDLPGATFHFCTSLKSICIPASVERIGGYCFHSPCLGGGPSTGVASLETLTFEPGSKLREICRCAFSGCNLLKRIRLPSSLKIVEGSSFCDCGLIEIEVEEGNSHLAMLDHFLVNFDRTLIIRHFGNDSEVAIPEPIQALGRSCFEGCKSVISVEFAGHCQVISIEERAFFDCSKLSSICIHSSVTSLGRFSFASCAGLQSVTFSCDSPLKTIDERTFYTHTSSLLKSIVIPSSIEVIDGWAFAYCDQLENVTFPSDSKLNRIACAVFAGCVSLRSFCVPSLVEVLGHHCFLGCESLSSFTFAIPSRVERLLDVGVETIDIPDSVEHLIVSTDLAGVTRHTLNFGHESKLVSFIIERNPLKPPHRRFLRFSTGFLKGTRSRSEFGQFDD
jgi:hypothetical protein